LIGSIPEELIALDHLEVLVLSDNSLSGRLPILKGLSTLKCINWQEKDGASEENNVWPNCGFSITIFQKLLASFV
jgi:hypothetical protein